MHIHLESLPTLKLLGVLVLWVAYVRKQRIWQVIHILTSFLCKVEACLINTAPKSLQQSAIVLIVSNGPQALALCWKWALSTSALLLTSTFLTSDHCASTFVNLKPQFIFKMTRARTKLRASNGSCYVVGCKSQHKIFIHSNRRMSNPGGSTLILI